MDPLERLKNYFRHSPDEFPPKGPVYWLAFVVIAQQREIDRLLGRTDSIIERLDKLETDRDSR